MSQTPMIKGVFVNSHIQALKAAKGPEGVEELAKMFGKPISFGAVQDVPVREEVRLIECTLAIMHPEIPHEQRAFEAGRLHFTNFRSTPLGRIIFKAGTKDFKKMMMGSRYLAQHVFKHTVITTEELGEKKLKLRMENADYPADHFRGLLFEWMKFFGLTGTVTVKIVSPGVYEYTLEWQ